MKICTSCKLEKDESDFHYKMKENNKKVVYVDLDGVTADFDKAKDQILEHDPEGHECKVREGFFANLELVEGAKEALEELGKYYELYFLSTPTWSNSQCAKEKFDWVKEHFPELMFKRLILCHNKGLLRGHYLIDDRITNGVDGFKGEHIHFGTEKFPSWSVVVSYLLNKVV